MTILNILTVGNDGGVLSTETVDLTKADILSSKIQTLIEDMKDTCHHVGGVGLAANQVGETAKLFVYKDPAPFGGFKTIINPVILAGRKGKFKSKGEGCLSLPGRRFTVVRQKQLWVNGLDEKGEEIEFMTKSKQLAKIIQHEVDHLYGRTIADKGKEVT